MTDKEKIEYYESLMWLAARDIVFFSTYDSEKGGWDSWFHPVINVSDTFVYACADAEPFEPHDIEKIMYMYEHYGTYGIMAMVAANRKEKVLQQLRNEKYYAALEYLGVSDEDFKDFYAKQ